MKKREYRIDLGGVRSARALHARLDGKLPFPEGYGRNLDALYDILTGLPHLGRRFRILLPTEDAPCRGYAEIMAQVFEDAGAVVRTD